MQDSPRTSPSYFIQTVWAVFFVVSGCGDGIHTVDHLGQPLVEINARIEGQLNSPIGQDSLLASLIWETIPEEVLNCLKTAESFAEVYYCANLVGFTTTLATRSIPVEPVFPAAFQMPIHALPSDDILSGEPGALLSYGILVVYEDGNRNQTLDLVPPQALSSYDTIMASSIFGSDQQFDFIIYREGELSPIWKMFEYLYDCPEPGQGFSVVSVTANRPLPTCSLKPIGDTQMVVTFNDSDQVRQLICEPTQVSSSFPDREPPPGSRIECIFDQAMTFVENPKQYCQHERLYELVGCHRPESCQEYDWNLIDTPPDWWPCDGSSSGGFAISDSPNAVTSVSDDLFYLHYLSGQERYAIEDLEVWVFEDAYTGWIFNYPLFLSHTDNDFDGLVSSGDTVLVYEALNIDKFNQDTISSAHAVQLRMTRPTLPDSPLANLIWHP